MWVCLKEYHSVESYHLLLWSLYAVSARHYWRGGGCVTRLKMMKGWNDMSEMSTISMSYRKVS